MDQTAVSPQSRVETELDFLVALEQGEVITQLTLSTLIVVSVGFINALPRWAVRKGVRKGAPAPYKRYAYNLTPKGFSEKGRLVAEYLQISLSFFHQARQEYNDLFALVRSSSMRKIALVGGGELAEIGMLAAREVGVYVEMIFNQTSNSNRLHRATVVRSREELSSVDGVVITDDLVRQQAFDQICEHFPKPQVFAPPLLHVTHAPLDFKPPKVLPKESPE